MTAGQRNCHMTLTHLRDQYGEANIAFALRELLLERIAQQDGKSKQASTLERFAADLDEMRWYLDSIA